MQDVVDKGGPAASFEDNDDEKSSSQGEEDIRTPREAYVR